MRAVIRIVCVGTVLLLHAALGEERDYTAAFQKLYQLGLPDVKDATYVRLRFGASTDYESNHGSLSFGYFHVDLEGNAWLVKENKEGASLFVENGARYEEIWDDKTVAREQAEQEATMVDAMESGAELPVPTTPAKQGGTWKDVDPAADAKKILAYFEGQDGEAQARNIDFGSGAERDFGALFLNAAHFCRAGLKDEANKIVATLFSKADDPRKVILAGVACLAEGQYANAYDTFRTTGNWHRYDSDLAKLHERFNGLWRKAPALELLRTQIAPRLTGPPPPIEGEGLTDADRKLADALAAIPGNCQSSVASQLWQRLWILGTASAWEEMGIPRGAKTPVSEIQERGMASIPLLLALLDDTYPMLLNAQRLGGMYGSSGRRDAADPAVLLQSLQRPATRGGVARVLLQPLLLLPDQERYGIRSASTSELKERCTAWYKTHRDKSPAELADLYLAEGSREQKRGAVMCLLGTAEAPEQFGKVEEYLLNDKDIYMAADLVRQYADSRGEDAKPFVAKYIKHLRSKPWEREEWDDYGSGEELERTAKRQIKMLEQLVSGASAEDLLADILAGKKTWRDVSQALRRALAETPVEKGVPMLLRAALAAKESNDKVYLIQSISTLGRGHGRARRMAMMGRRSVSGKKDAAKPKITDHADLWNQLLQQGEAAESARNSEAAWGYTGNQPLTSAVYWEIEQFYRQKSSGQPQHRFYSVLSGLPDSGKAVLKARAEARLAGTSEDELPPFPSEGNVSAERRTQITEEVMAAGNEAIPNLLDKLSDSERLAFAAEVRKNDKLDAKLRDVANRIAVVAGASDGIAVPDGLEALKGRILNTEICKQAFEISKELVKQNQSVGIYFTRKTNVGGVTVTVAGLSATDGASYYWRRHAARKEATPLVIGAVHGGRVQGNGYWPVKDAQQPKKADVKQAPDAKADPDAELAKVSGSRAGMDDTYGGGTSQFWEKIDKLGTADVKSCDPAGVLFFAVGASVIEELRKRKDQGDEEMYW